MLENFTEEHLKFCIKAMKRRPEKVYKTLKDTRFFVQVDTGYAELCANYQSHNSPCVPTYINVSDLELLQCLQNTPQLDLEVAI
jgi:hypothetical protein